MKASTCFFNLWIPQYSSYEILKAKITQAIILDNVTLNAEEDDLADMQPRHHDDISEGGSEMEY